jgi:glycosyltransferase involved in cell wall biosynthesis
MANPVFWEQKSIRCLARAHKEFAPARLLSLNIKAFESLHSRPVDRTPDEPLISVIIPSYNQGAYIDETIRSILMQDYPNVQIIVIDGGSTDNTIDVLRNYPQIEWVSEKDKGQTHAINKGILRSRGEIVAYLNSDDAYRPGALRAVAETFRTEPYTQIVVGNCDYIDRNSNVIGFLKARLDRTEDLIRYWGWNRWYCIPQQATFWRRSLIAEAGLFDTSLHFVMDLDYWMRVVQITRFRIIDQTLAAFRLMPGTKTVSSTDRMYKEEYATYRRHKKLLPPTLRMRASIAARRHYANKQLMMAQHYLLSVGARRLAAQLLFESAKVWPPGLANPLAVLCIAHLGLSLIGSNNSVLERIHRRCLSALHRGT